MKKIVPFAFLMLAFCTVFAQSKSYKMYDVFSGRDGITDFGFSKSMVDALDINFDDNDGERNVKGDLTEIRFMSYNPEKGDLSGDQFLKKAIGYLPKSAYKNTTMEKQKTIMPKYGSKEKGKNTANATFLSVMRIKMGFVLLSRFMATLK